MNLHNPPAPASLAPRRRTLTAAALAAAGYAATLAAVTASVPLSRAAAVQVLFAATMIVCALAETLHSPAAPAIGADPAGPAAAARAKRLRTRALAAGCLLGPSAGGAALGAGWGTSLLTALAVACALAGIATQRASGSPRSGGARRTRSYHTRIGRIRTPLT